VSAVFASFLTCVALTTVAGSSARAADDCITGPKGQAPQGSHWYYSLNRVTHRKCWYLGAEGLKVRQVASRKPSLSAMPTLQQRAETPTLKSVVDAHAEQLIEGPSAELPIVANPTAQPPPEGSRRRRSAPRERGEGTDCLPRGLVSQYPLFVAIDVARQTDSCRFSRP
jgi:hypothetical protein